MMGKKFESYRAHPWHGLDLGEKAPVVVNCYVEMVPTDTVKYEIDKKTGILKVDRPQKYSSLCPTLYGLLPQTYAGDRVGNFCRDQCQIDQVKGDGDPLDVCILTEKTIVRGDIIVRAIPIGGLRLIDGGQADDKIVAVMEDDFIYGKFQDVLDCPQGLIERLHHYFLTYKDHPDQTDRKIKVMSIYGRQEAHEVIRLSCLDYQELVAD